MSDDSNLHENEYSNNENGENFNFNQDFMLPPSHWVYATPPMQKIKKPKLKGCSIKTAVMYKSVHEKEMFELNPNIIADIATLGSIDEIPYDPRYKKALMFDQNNGESQEYSSVLEPSRQTKFVSRYQMGLLRKQTIQKFKRNLFEYKNN